MVCCFGCCHLVDRFGGGNTIESFMEILYQIENGKSGRRLIYRGFEKISWSEGEGHDGTFFTKEQLDFVLSLRSLNLGFYCSGGDCFIIEYRIERFSAPPK